MRSKYSAPAITCSIRHGQDEDVGFSPGQNITRAESHRETLQEARSSITTKTAIETVNIEHDDYYYDDGDDDGDDDDGDDDDDDDDVDDDDDDDDDD
ncbi:hypothetical protein ElyMa_000420100 [Elysia marginata]|uniref:Uncharacterized protein n=1 Tax=Elysia marginata TaxID=1093978 RepID=A0AAV4FM58_9GAST|nr:hypothetical protein ElyMa_000420100 [Elysia marginata]